MFADGGDIEVKAPENPANGDRSARPVRITEDSKP
jgi:hypothetical protein